MSSTPMSTGTTEPSLLLSRLPNDESLSSFLVDSEEPLGKHSAEIMEIYCHIFRQKLGESNVFKVTIEIGS